MKNQPVKRMATTKEPPGIIFEFDTEAEADAFFNNGFQSDLKSRLEGNAVLLRLPVNQTLPDDD